MEAGVTTDSKIVKERSSDMAHDLTQDLQDVNIDSKSKLISKNIDVPAELARARSKRTASFVVIGGSLVLRVWLASLTKGTRPR